MTLRNLKRARGPTTTCSVAGGGQFLNSPLYLCLAYCTIVVWHVVALVLALNQHKRQAPEFIDSPCHELMRISVGVAPSPCAGDKNAFGLT